MASSRNKIRSALLGRILFVALSVPRYPQPHPPLKGYTNKLHRDRIICLASARQMTGFFVYRWGCLSA
jgi:hypothetical protein